jgi:hypothetical protein
MPIRLRRILSVGLVLALVVLADAACVARAAKAPAQSSTPRTKYLIEMGWDEPDPAFMRRNLAQLEASPFDGCVFHVDDLKADTRPGRFTWEVWGSRRFSERDVAPALADLQATPFHRFQQNFLRLNVTPGNVDWFDDHSTIWSNLTLAASVARRGRTAGIFLDTEAYEGKLWTYDTQRDARSKSYEDYCKQARKRGGEAMRALEKGWPGLTVFVTMGVVYPWVWAGAKKEKIRYEHWALLGPFMDGMISAASDSVRIVDGMEASYYVKDPKKIDDYHEYMTKQALDFVSDKKKYPKLVSRSFGIWMDHNSPIFKWHVDRPDSNYRPPAQLQAVVRRALERADDYVWVYSQTPFWWSDQGKPLRLPPAYDKALREARKGLTPP